MNCDKNKHIALNTSSLRYGSSSVHFALAVFFIYRSFGGSCGLSAWNLQFYFYFYSPISAIGAYIVAWSLCPYSCGMHRVHFVRRTSFSIAKRFTIYRYNKFYRSYFVEHHRLENRHFIVAIYNFAWKTVSNVALSHGWNRYLFLLSVPRINMSIFCENNDDDDGILFQVALHSLNR